MDRTTHGGMAALSNIEHPAHKNERVAPAVRTNLRSELHLDSNRAAEPADHFVERDGLRFAGRPGEQLFTSAFYEGCQTLIRPHGMIALQSGAPFYNPEQLEGVCGRLAHSFYAVRPFVAPVPTYAGGMSALVVAGESDEALRPPIETLRMRVQQLGLRTRYYTPEIHRAAFTLAPDFTPVLARLQPRVLYTLNSRARPTVPSFGQEISRLSSAHDRIVQ